MTCAPWEQLNLPPSISSAAASPVRTCPAQERAQALLASAQACGVSSLVSSVSFGPPGSSWRTSPAEPSGGSTPWCANWASSGMRAYRSRSRRAIAALPTDEPESSLLPTLAACGNYNRAGASANSGDGLRTASLPTLTVTQYGSSAGGESPSPARLSIDAMARRGMLPTMTASAASRGKAMRGQNAQGGPSLHEFLLPTMTRRDDKGPGPKHTRAGSDLPQALGGHLNPAWCLWFMGFPADWLDADDAHAFAPSATPSSRNAPKSSAT